MAFLFSLQSSAPLPVLQAYFTTSKTRNPIYFRFQIPWVTRSAQRAKPSHGWRAHARATYLVIEVELIVGDVIPNKEGRETSFLPYF